VIRTLLVATWMAGAALVDWGTAPKAQSAWRHDALASFDEVWQTVDQTFYDPTFGGLDWNAVRAELRPRAEAAPSADDVRRVIVEMLGRLKRSHFVVLSASASGDEGPIGEATVPIDVRIITEGLVVTRSDAGSIPARAGIQPGQIVLSIDGATPWTWKAGGDAAGVPTRRFDQWRRAYRALHGDLGSRAVLRVRLPSGAEREVVVDRTPEAGEVVTLGNLPPLPVRTETHEIISPARHRIGFVAFNVWMTAIDAPVAAAIDTFRKADGLVIDLRGNPGGLAPMISGIAGHLINDPTALLGRMQTRQGPLEFRPNPRLSTTDGRRVAPYAGPVAILVDDLTGSASECFAGALQGLGRARVFGRQTMGEALPALTKRLPDGDVLMYAVGDFITASGRSLEGSGVRPDELISLSAAVLATGRDPDVDAALRWFDGRE
jgi:carboxyl-terminal processing protease